MTRKFFESILRASEDNPSLAVSRVLVRQMEDLKRHFCSGEVTYKAYDPWRKTWCKIITHV